MGNLRGVRAAAVCIGRTALLWGARVRERCDGHCDCVLLYRGGISGGNADEEKYKALRVCGLVLVLLCVVKLVLVDIRYDNVLLRAAGFFVGGILCFGISLVYNLVDKWMGRRENAKN